jgi:2-oxoisovalerate dehydrogenase E2 component (dihydrolipoyl transacylase)
VSQFVFKLPDLGEGTVEAEIVGWRVKPGDRVSEDDVIVEVMTDKAAVEVPAPVAGRVVSINGSPGDLVPVGSTLIVFETGDQLGEVSGRETVNPAATSAALPFTNVASREAGSVGAHPANNVRPTPSVRGNGSGVAHANGHHGRVATSPAIRRRAHEAGVDLRNVAGSGPNGRIVRKDFDAYLQQHAASARAPRGVPEKLTALRPRPGESGGTGLDVGIPVGIGTARSTEGAVTEEIKVIGLRRLIAQRMSEAKRNIPHFAYVEEVDVTELEALRRHLNSKLATGTAALTYLPFLALALVRVLKDFPQANALYDSERGVIIRHRAVHVGIATQTPEGLKVPVVRNAQARSLADLAAEIRRVSEAARTNKAAREELTGSTITLTSLGKLGGIASTPIINAPEVAIIGVNRALERPIVLNGAIAIRRMMNISSSFDHRFVDGYDAAALIQALKERIEHPATIFIDV